MKGFFFDKMLVPTKGGGNPWPSYWATRAAFYMGEWDFANGLLLDRTANGNNFAIGHSYCINPLGGNAVLTTPIVIDTTISWSVKFEIFKLALEETGKIAGGGNAGQDNIGILNDRVYIQSASGGNLFFYNVVATVGRWDRIEITSDGTNITVTNITSGATETKSRGATTSITLVSIFGRGSSATGELIHPIRFLNINDVSEFHFSEYPTNSGLYPSYYYDIIGGNHAPTNTSYVNRTLQTDDFRHHNLQNGYSIWENGVGGIVWVPYGSNGEPLTLTPGVNIQAGYEKTFDCPPHVSRHNGCETTIKAPAALLPYDVDNFMFDESDVAKEIAFENVAENRGNQIFANKTVENYYYDLVVLKTPEV
jgi:hypothetical protein